MEKAEHYLNLLATISGIIAFVWIGFRADGKSFSAAVVEIRNAQPRWRGYGPMILAVGPYVVFGIAAVYLLFREFEIRVKHHILKTVQASDQAVPILPFIELSSTNTQFQITIKGAIFGPELRRIHMRYGDGHVKVYAVVQETAPWGNKASIKWIQGGGSGILGSDGSYCVRAFLGGISDTDTAKDGETFRVFIYIPHDQSDRAIQTWNCDEDTPLPRALFLSEPLFIKCRRPNVR